MGESGKGFAERVLDEQYGRGNYPKEQEVNTTNYRNGATQCAMFQVKNVIYYAIRIHMAMKENMTK